MRTRRANRRKMPRAQSDELMIRPKPDMSSTPIIQFADDTTLSVYVRGWALALSLTEGVAILEWLQANEAGIRGHPRATAEVVPAIPA